MGTDDGFRVADRAPDDAGLATGRVADGVRGVDLGRPVREAAAALPGSAFAGAAAGVIAAWSGHGRGVADDLAAHAKALTGAAGTYWRADASALDALDAAGEVR